MGLAPSRDFPTFLLAATAQMKSRILIRRAPIRVAQAPQASQFSLILSLHGYPVPHVRRLEEVLAGGTEAGLTLAHG
jgi:hypothetical protein